MLVPLWRAANVHSDRSILRLSCYLNSPEIDVPPVVGTAVSDRPQSQVIRIYADWFSDHGVEKRSRPSPNNGGIGWTFGVYLMEPDGTYDYRESGRSYQGKADGVNMFAQFELQSESIVKKLCETIEITMPYLETETQH